MSYNVGFYVQVEDTGKCVCFDSPEYGSVPYSYRSLLKECMNFEFNGSVYYQCDFVLDITLIGIKKLTLEPYDYKQKYDYEMIHETLMLLWAIAYKIVQIGKEIPLDKFYMKWC